MKWLLRIGLLVVLLVVVAVVAGFILIDNIATTAVQKGAAFATETDVEVESVDVSVFGASATIDNLDIKNPDGEFRDKFDSFLVLGNASAEVSAGSVMSDLVEVPSVELNDITLSLVSFDDGSKNYEVILESLKRFQGDGPPPEETEGGKEFVIKLTTINRITVNYDFAKDPAIGVLPAEGTIEIAFDEPMIIENLGQGGVPMSQITADLITDILLQVTANMASQLGDQFTGHLQGLSGSLMDTLGENKFTEAMGELNLGEGAKELIGGIGEGAGDIVGGIGGILGGDKDKEDDEGEGKPDEEEEEEKGLLDDINPF